MNKINTKVNFPINDFDISNYVISKEKDQKIKYDLFAVANHYGSLHFGHYTAFCKNSLNDKWYEYNDSCVTEINDVSKIISQNAYVLFYRRKGLSKLNWKNIYEKKFMEIDINNPDTLVDFNYDFIYNVNNKTEKDDKSDEKDINEFDIIINDVYNIKKEEKKNQMAQMQNKQNEENDEFSDNIDLENLQNEIKRDNIGSIMESIILRNRQNDVKKENINLENICMDNKNAMNNNNNRPIDNNFLNKKRSTPDNI
jgi:hypothetical protein